MVELRETGMLVLLILINITGRCLLVRNGCMYVCVSLIVLFSVES